MKLIFRGHEDRYAVEQSLLAFFPEERPVYEPAEDGEDHALVTLSRSPRYNTAVTTITYHGRTARGISRTAVDPQLTEYEAERLRQKAALERPAAPWRRKSASGRGCSTSFPSVAGAEAVRQ